MSKVEVMSLHKFLEKSRNNEFEYEFIMNPEAIKLAASVLLYLMLYSQPVLAGPLDKIGNKFWSYATNFAYWSYLVMGTVESVKQVQAGDQKSIWKVFLKYVAAYAITRALPWAFKEVDSAFSTGK